MPTNDANTQTTRGCPQLTPLLAKQERERIRKTEYYGYNMVSLSDYYGCVWVAGQNGDYDVDEQWVIEQELVIEQFVAVEENITKEQYEAFMKFLAEYEDLSYVNTCLREYHERMDRPYSHLLGTSNQLLITYVMGIGVQMQTADKGPVKWCSTYKRKR